MSQGFFKLNLWWGDEEFHLCMLMVIQVRFLFGIIITWSLWRDQFFCRRSKESETVFWSKLQELDRAKILGQEVRWVFVTINKIDFHELTLYYFPNIVESYVNML